MVWRLVGLVCIWLLCILGGVGTSSCACLVSRSLVGRGGNTAGGSLQSICIGLSCRIASVRVGRNVGVGGVGVLRSLGVVSYIALRSLV